ncbi:MAG: hypothetical protein LIR46_06070 [Bacteroidota bacterium]|nr:hypothetical protein [Bacteroidota bacterium]
MNEYYGIASTPTDDFLAHYGVKGMRWGVRKSIEKGNDAALERHYHRAQKKLVKLNARTDIKKQAELSKKYDKAAKISGKIGLAGAGTLAGLHGAKSLSLLAGARNREKAIELYENSRNANYSPSITRYRRLAEEYDDRAMNADFAHREISDMLDPRYGGTKSLIGTAARVATIGGVGAAAGLKIGSKVAKYRTTPKGHAKAVAKRNAWKKEMDKAFKGTPYDRTRKKRRG